MESEEQEFQSLEPEVVEEPLPGPMSVGATIGITFAVGAIAVFSQIVFMIVWVVVLMIGGQSMDDAEFLMNGNLVFGSVVFSYPLVLGAMFAIIHFRKGPSLKEYLGWHDWRTLKLRQYLPWFGGLIGLMVLFEFLATPFVSSKADMMEGFILSTEPWLMVVALVVGAPLVEELFFRGYMFKSFERSRLGGVGTVVVTSLVWVAIHGFQYGPVELTYLILIGGLLGAARLKSGAIALPIALHVINNLIVVLSLLSQH